MGFYRVEIAKEFTPEVNALTHTPPHHADEAFATAILSVLYPLTVFCTRDEEVIRDFEGFMYDVGGEYDHARKRYDHHQRGFEEWHVCGGDGRGDGGGGDDGSDKGRGDKDSGHKMAAAGLVWRHYGARATKRILGETDGEDFVNEVAKLVDEKLLAGLDANDNGELTDDGALMTIPGMMGMFNVQWDEEGDPEEAFLATVKIAQQILARAVVVAAGYVRGREIVNASVAKASGRYFMLYRMVNGWAEMVAESDDEKARELLYGITKDSTMKAWRVRALPPDAGHMMAMRKPFPKKWCGLSGAELAAVTGVKTASFCHANGFLAVAGTKEDAIRLAELAIEA